MVRGQGSGVRVRVARAVTGLLARTLAEVEDDHTHCDDDHLVRVRSRARVRVMMTTWQSK